MRPAVRLLRGNSVLNVMLLQLVNVVILAFVLVLAFIHGFLKLADF
jgi:hypothetical protein